MRIESALHAVGSHVSCAATPGKGLQQAKRYAQLLDLRSRTRRTPRASLRTTGVQRVASWARPRAVVPARAHEPVGLGDSSRSLGESCLALHACTIAKLRTPAGNAFRTSASRISLGREPPARGNEPPNSTFSRPASGIIAASTTWIHSGCGGTSQTPARGGIAKPIQISSSDSSSPGTTTTSNERTAGV